MIEEADRDGDKMIDREEFFRVMKKKGDNPLDDLDTE
jgi:centrin-1